MAKRAVSQNDLRKMMADIKSSKPTTAATSTSKKLKLSSRELALLEEREEKKRLKEKAKEEKLARKAALIPNKDLKPQKSILKNSSRTPSSSFIPVAPKKSATIKPAVQDKPVITEREKRLEPDEEEAEKNDETNTESLPEGFFDDPMLDAKARHVQYVDTAEEEWEKFQKEIADEMTTAQDILVEDRNEATVDRQLEEIDDQIRAWHRVAEMEKKKEVIASVSHGSDSTQNESKDDSDVGSDEDYEEFMDWRKKC